MKYDSVFSFCDLADRQAARIQHKKFWSAFAYDPVGPYAIQRPGREWRTRYKPVSDPLIAAHLRGEYWLATRAQHYAKYSWLDVDAPGPGAVERILERLDAGGGQYLIFTSPSWARTRNVHIALRATYRGRWPQAEMAQRALRTALADACEVYPQVRRKFRAPLGRDQHLLDKNFIPLQMPWWEAMEWFDRMDEFPLDDLPHAAAAPPVVSAAKNEDDPRGWRPSAAVAELLENGLTGPGTRHRALWDIAVWLYRNNVRPERTEAQKFLRRWLKAKHNGFSKDVNAGRWRALDDEIERIVTWIWTNFRPYPDAPHNEGRAVTRADMEWIAQLFPGDVVNQKRLTNLVSYYRPRQRHEWVWIPRDVWRDGTGKPNVAAFRQTLEAKGVLESIHDYRHHPDHKDANYAKRFKLRLPATNEEPVMRDERHVADYYQVARILFKSVREMTAFFGVSHQRFYGGEKTGVFNPELE
jgi:hypothetical protein